MINNPSDMGYIMHLSDLLHRQGLGHVAAVDWRGLGGQELRSVTGTPKPYSAAAFGDVGSILTHLRARLPSSPIIGVGWSMGGGMLLRHMGEAGEACELAGAMAVSPLVDLAKNYEHMGSKLINSIYLPIIMGPLLAYLFRHRHALAHGATEGVGNCKKRYHFGAASAPTCALREMARMSVSSPDIAVCTFRIFSTEHRTVGDIPQLPRQHGPRARPGWVAYRLCYVRMYVRRSRSRIRSCRY